MTRLVLPLVLLAAAPAAAQVVAAEPPVRVSPDGKLEVQHLAGPHAGTGRRAPEGAPGGPGCAIQRLVIAPGGGVPEHVHATSDETVVILAGAGTFTLEGRATAVRAGSTVFVPMGRRHSFLAEGAGPTVAFQVYDPAGPEARFLAWPVRSERAASPAPAPGNKP